MKTFAVLPALAALLVPPLTAKPAQDVSDPWSWLEIRSDNLEPLPGVGVLLKWGQDSAAFTTGSTGRTRGIQVPAGTPVEITLAEARTPMGSTVGQVTMFTSAQAAEERNYSAHGRIVPEARTTKFKAEPMGSEDYLTHDPYTRSWYAHPANQDASYAFAAGVAALRAADVVDGYFYYHNTVPAQSYVQGLLIRSFTAQDLEGDVVVFAINKLGHGYQTPAVDIVHVTSGSSQPGLATIVHEDDQFILVSYAGAFPQGDTLILLHEAQGGTIHVPQDPRDVPPPSKRAGDSFSDVPSSEGEAEAEQSTYFLMPTPTAFTPEPAPDGGFQWCPPPKPADSYCTLPENDSTDEPDNDCGADLIITGKTESKTEIIPAWTDPPPCNPAGLSDSIRICWEYTGHMEFSFKLGPVVNLGAGGSASYERCLTRTVDECTCIGTWECEWSQTTSWNVCTEKSAWVWGEGVVTNQFWTREWYTDKGSYAIQQPTTCVPNGSGCGTDAE